MTLESIITNFVATYIPVDPIIIGLVIMLLVGIAMFSFRFSGGEALIVMFMFSIGLASLALGSVFGNIKAFGLVIVALVVGYFLWTKFANG